MTYIFGSDSDEDGVLMSRYVQKAGTKGSLRWIQEYVNGAPQELGQAIADASQNGIRAPIRWRSPRREDEFAEYRDQAFLDLVGIKLPRRRLEEFWPRGGPQWDALGVSESGQPILVEAKANIPEVISPASEASEKSLARIDASLEETARFLGARSSCDWSGTFYQYANRLAHLYLLSELNQIDAWLVFVYFIGDAEVSGPDTEAEWKAALRVMYGALGLSKRHALSSRIVDVFVDVRDR